MAEKLKFRLHPKRALILPDGAGGKIVAVGVQCTHTIGQRVLMQPQAFAESFRVVVDGVIHRIVWDRDVTPVTEEE